MLREVAGFIREQNMIQAGDCVLAGLSGGADSVCMTEILYRLQEELDFRLAAVHVHHGIRGAAADRDAAFAEAFARERDIPFLCIKTDVPAFMKENGLSMEEAARILRYRAFQTAAEKFQAQKIATAHHLDDQAETILFQLMRGSALTGLSGMRPVNGQRIRPLLTRSREEILAWLQQEGLRYTEDESNAEDQASRNRIRHHILPEMRKIRPDAAEKISETAAYIRSVDEYLEQEAADWLAVPGHCTSAAKEVRIQADALGQAPEVLRTYIIRTALKQLGAGLKDLTRTHYHEAAELAYKPVGKRIDLPGKLLAQRTYTEVVLRTSEPDEVPSELPFVLRIEVFPRPDSQKIQHFLKEKQYTKCFDYDRISTSPVLRNRRSGDVFSTAPGTSKKLSDYMIDVKIPREERDRVPLVADGPNILWVVGYRMSEAYKVTESTGMIAMITVIPKEKGNDKDE